MTSATKDKSAPIKMFFKSANVFFKDNKPANITTFNSYSFERNILSPGAPFRFTAPGVDKYTRLAIRSGDTVQLFATNKKGDQILIATGFIDETDTHIAPHALEYVLTGRDTLGQLIDNAAVDKNNKLINQDNLTITDILKLLVQNTRIPQEVITQDEDSGTFLFQTNVQETKINALQRYMELANCLVWTMPNGQVKLGKPNFAQKAKGSIFVTQGNSNILDCRVRRNLNNAIRMIVVQLQTLKLVNPTPFTIQNNDPDMQEVSDAGVGRSVYRLCSFGEGSNTVNTLTHVPNTPGNINQLGAAYANREVARENVQTLDVEVTLQGHLDSNGNIYDVDNKYYCVIPDEDIATDLYAYGVKHELTLEHGMITTLRLCKLGTLVDRAAQMARQAA